MERRHSTAPAAVGIGIAFALTVGWVLSMRYDVVVLRAVYVGTGAGVGSLVLAVGWQARAAFERLMDQLELIDQRRETDGARAVIREISFLDRALGVTALAGSILIAIAEYIGDRVSMSPLEQATATVAGSISAGLIFGLLWWSLKMLTGAIELRRDLRAEVRAADAIAREADQRRVALERRIKARA